MKININKITTIAAFAFFLSGCVSAPMGPKLFTHATLLVKTDGVITVPADMPKDFIETFRNREFALLKSELIKRGDLVLSEKCAANTMKIIVEITSIIMSENATYSISFLGNKSTKNTGQKMSISTAVKIEDCANDKLLFDKEIVEDGDNPVEILKSLASDNIKLAYKQQHQKINFK